MSAFLRELFHLQVFQLLVAGGFNPAFKSVGEGQGSVNDADVKSTREPSFEHLKGALLVLGVARSFQELFKGGDVHVDVAVLHVESLEFSFCLNTFGNVHIGVFETFGEVFPKFFIGLGVSVGQLPVYDFLLLIGSVFNFAAMDVAKAQGHSLIGDAEGGFPIVELPPSNVGVQKFLCITPFTIKGLGCSA